MKSLLKCQEMMTRKSFRLFIPLFAFISIDLLKQKYISISQQINFVRRVEEDGSVAMIFIAEK